MAGRRVPWRADNAWPVSLHLPSIHHSQRHVSSPQLSAQVRGALRRLGTEYLDVLTLHWDDFGVAGYVDAGLYLAELQAAGLVGGRFFC